MFMVDKLLQKQFHAGRICRDMQESCGPKFTSAGFFRQGIETVLKSHPTGTECSGWVTFHL
jgi:hypothetical protein